MKQKLFIALALVLMIAALVALNAVSYSQRQTEPETETFPNRSSFNYGPTGTNAFYSLLSETGRKPVHWLEPIDALELNRKDHPATFVMVGPFSREITPTETGSLLRWVAGGGRLVLIDREPPAELLKADRWTIDTVPGQMEGIFDVDPSDQNAMTRGKAAAKPSQPSLVTFGVNAVQASKFAAAFVLNTRTENDGVEHNGTGQIHAKAQEVVAAAPVFHLMADGKGLVADTRYGSGQIIMLSDPYVVANGGISIVDNAQLGLNLVSGGGPVAFDEFHHGYGAKQNRLVEFFAGTPVVAIFFQCVLIVGLIFYSQSRRFGRALPAAAEDRLSKLEYIGAMAELQQRTRAYDLAIENIYRDFRRRAARLLGVDNMTVKRDRFAALIAEKAKADAAKVDELMFQCEEIIAGEGVRSNDAVAYASEIRRLERAMGLRRRTS